MELEVFLNDSVAKEVAGGQDLETFLGEFAGWVPAPFEGSREFLHGDIELLLGKMKDDPNTATVFGFHEFPYTAGGTLQGPEREIEREYWLQLNNVGARCVVHEGCVLGLLLIGWASHAAWFPEMPCPDVSANVNRCFAGLGSTTPWRSSTSTTRTSGS